MSQNADELGLGSAASGKCRLQICWTHHEQARATDGQTDVPDALLVVA
jgi:hypothetical protein